MVMELVSVFHFVNLFYIFISQKCFHMSKMYGKLKRYKKHILKTSLYSNDCKISIAMRSDDLNSVIRPTSSIINRRTF